MRVQAVPSAPKAWLDLDGLAYPDNVTKSGTNNIADVQRAFHGFRAMAYPFSGPCTCAGFARRGHRVRACAGEAETASVSAYGEPSQIPSSTANWNPF